MSDPFFFGYGSLVNRATHEFPRAAKAVAYGWGRIWKRTRLREVAFLTAVEAPGSKIEGLIAAVPGADWAGLDAREWAYDRLPVMDLTHDHVGDLDVQIYRTKPEHDTDGSEAHPILLSYLDTVVQGYLTEFGEDGALRFFETTSGWDTPILDDRAAPRYPRAQVLTQAEVDFVDAQLTALGCDRIFA
ncbi:MAG: gamma-glutamylcyclotransferase family protein [Pseudomonadota bacterium]